MGAKKIMLTIDEDIVKDIDQKAKDDGRSRNNYINRIIIEYLQSENKTKDLISEIEILKKELMEKSLIIKNLPQQPIAQQVSNVKNNDNEDELIMPMQIVSFNKK